MNPDQDKLRQEWPPVRSWARYPAAMTKSQERRVPPQGPFGGVFWGSVYANKSPICSS
ncbi:MAG: hypothetical protein H7829_17390 [Magnetococcus sp. THC-1_WYH]